LPGHLPALVARLASAAKAGAAEPGDPLANAIRRNVIDNVANLKSASPILDAAVAQGKLKVVGGVYRLASGRVEMMA
jgi:carbonic anhydrase